MGIGSAIRGVAQPYQSAPQPMDMVQSAPEPRTYQEYLNSRRSSNGLIMTHDLLMTEDQFNSTRPQPIQAVFPTSGPQPQPQPQPMGGKGGGLRGAIPRAPQPVSSGPQPAFYTTPSQPEPSAPPQFQFQPREYVSPFRGMGGKGGMRSMGGKGGFSPFGSYYETPNAIYSRPFDQTFAPRYQGNPYAQQPPMLTQPVENPQFRSLPYTPGGMQPVSQVLPAEPIFESGMKPGGRPLVGDRMPTRQPIGGKGFFKQGGQVK